MTVVRQALLKLPFLNPAPGLLQSLPYNKKNTIKHTVLYLRFIFSIMLTAANNTFFIRQMDYVRVIPDFVKSNGTETNRKRQNTRSLTWLEYRHCQINYY